LRGCHQHHPNEKNDFLQSPDLRFLGPQGFDGPHGLLAFFLLGPQGLDAFFLSGAQGFCAGCLVPSVADFCSAPCVPDVLGVSAERAIGAPTILAIARANAATVDFFDI
jgi:hypothetical protein